MAAQRDQGLGAIEDAPHGAADGPRSIEVGSLQPDPMVTDHRLERSNSSPPLRRILALVDGTAVLLGWLTALATVYLLGEITFGPLTVIAQTVVILGGGAFLLSANGLYRRRVCAIRSAEVARIGLASLGLAGMTVAVLATTGREAALLAGLVGGLTWMSLLTFERGLLREWIHGRRAGGDFGAPVLVIGGDAASTLGTASFLDEHPVLGFVVRGSPAPPRILARTAASRGSTLPMTFYVKRMSWMSRGWWLTPAA